MDKLKYRALTHEQIKINEVVDDINLIRQTVSQDGTVVATKLGNDANCGQLLSKEVVISAADITATTAGKLGHAAGVPLVANPGADYLAELVSAVLIYDFDTAAYTAGGNITVNENGGSALTGVVSAANSLGAASDKIATFVPLAVTAANRNANKGLNLVAATAFTQPGTAAGVVRVHVQYRLHKLGLV